jgi:hypothetical protein
LKNHFVSLKVNNQRYFSLEIFLSSGRKNSFYFLTPKYRDMIIAPLCGAVQCIAAILLKIFPGKIVIQNCTFGAVIKKSAQ